MSTQSQQPPPPREAWAENKTNNEESKEDDQGTFQSSYYYSHTTTDDNGEVHTRTYRNGYGRRRDNEGQDRFYVLRRNDRFEETDQNTFNETRNQHHQFLAETGVNRRPRLSFPTPFPTLTNWDPFDPDAHRYRRPLIDLFSSLDTLQNYAPPTPETPEEELARLRIENAELRARIGDNSW